MIALVSFFGSRFVDRSAKGVARERHDADWNATYRAGAEAHIGWDYMIIGRLQRVERELGIDEPVPDPPPLFPKPEKEKAS